MSFLTIPGQEGLFRTIRDAKSGEEADGRSAVDAEGSGGGPNYEDEDEDDDPENVRLIPRCSPVPRKRGQSINDETAEYIRIHLGLSAGKRVSFADTTGGELVDVREFVAFDSDDDEEAGARWEEEEAKYRRRARREPTYRVLPEFTCPGGGALLQAVRDAKVEVERLEAVEGEPLAVGGLVRVLNVSFHKSVYVRSTMDRWLSYYDHPAEYVPGSSDGTTDRFSFKLSFAPPYVTHGSRIEFVVRYETSDGDFWANNRSLNYAVTLLLSYEEEEPDRPTVDPRRLRGILKPPRYHSSGNTESDSEDEAEKEKEASMSGLGVCPVIVQPEIDIELIEASATT